MNKRQIQILSLLSNKEAYWGQSVVDFARGKGTGVGYNLSNPSSFDKRFENNFGALFNLPATIQEIAKSKENDRMNQLETSNNAFERGVGSAHTVSQNPMFVQRAGAIGTTVNSIAAKAGVPTANPNFNAATWGSNLNKAEQQVNNYAPALTTVATGVGQDNPTTVVEGVRQLQGAIPGQANPNSLINRSIDVYKQQEIQKLISQYGPKILTGAGAFLLPLLAGSFMNGWGGQDNQQQQQASPEMLALQQAQYNKAIRARDPRYRAWY